MGKVLFQRVGELRMMNWGVDLDKLIHAFGRIPNKDGQLSWKYMILCTKAEFRPKLAII